jgi:hypothetical protein
MSTQQLRLAWLLLVILGVPAVAWIPAWPAPLTPHLIWGALVLVGTGFVIWECRRQGEHRLARDFWCLLIGLASGLIASLFI